MSNIHLTTYTTYINGTSVQISDSGGEKSEIMDAKWIISLELYLQVQYAPMTIKDVW